MLFLHKLAVIGYIRNSEKQTPFLIYKIIYIIFYFKENKTHYELIKLALSLLVYII